MRSFLTFFLLLLSCLSSDGQAWKGVIHQDLAFLKKQAEEGDPAAMADYAFHSLRCLDDLPYEPKLIFDFFKKSAAAGDLDGKMGLAHCYCFGIGTPLSFGKTYKLVQEGLKEDHPVALKLMAILHRRTHDLFEINPAKFLEYNQRAAEGGSLGARYNEVIRHFWKGKDRNYQEGMKQLRKFYKETKFPMAAIELFQKTVDLKEGNLTKEQEEIYRDALHYCDLGEPYCLFEMYQRLASMGFHERSIPFLLKSARQGNGKAWMRLDSLTLGGPFPDKKYDLIAAPKQSKNAFRMNAYFHGSWSYYSIGSVAWDILQKLDEPKMEEALPFLEVDLRKALAANRRDVHGVLGRLYLFADPEKYPDLYHPEWGVPHLIQHKGNGAVAVLGRHFFSAEPTLENLSKGYACAILSRKRKTGPWIDDKVWESQLKEMTPAALARGKQLVEENYPAAPKFKKAATKYLLGLGHLKPQKKK